MVRLILTVFLWLTPLWASAATIVAQFDRNPVALGDQVTLRFTVDGIVSGEPDFSPLQKDFDLRGRSQSTSFSMTNGVGGAQTVWELSLFPRNTGTLKVPPVSFGSDQSQPVELQVLEQPQGGAAGGADVMVELEAEPKQPYVQQQVIVTQRLFHISDFQGQASLSHPPIEQGKGDIQQLGNTRNTTMMRDGRNYLVAERRYVLHPQQSGELTVGRTAFEGVLEQPGMGSYDPFGVAGQRVRRFSKPLTLQVQGQPASYTGKQWLPAKSITLNAHWQTPAGQLKAGEPVTLTLAIVADGLAAEQLPKLDVAAPAGIKAYTDQPELRNDAGNSGVIGVRQEKWVIVAPYNGDYELPAITLDWWNTATGKQETAQVSATKLVVTGGQAAPAGVTTPPEPAKAAAPEQSPAKQPAGTTTPTTPKHGLTIWEWLASILLGFWIAVTLLWVVWRGWKKRKLAAAHSLQPSSAKLPTRRTDTQAALKTLEQACKQNQPQAAHDALLEWVDAGLKLRPALFSTLYSQADENLQAKLDELNSALYGRAGDNWRGDGLWQAIRIFKPVTAKIEKPEGLEALYPEE
jgi:hypothetical protein